MSHIVNSASEGTTVIMSRANVIQAVNMKERMAKEFSELVTKWEKREENLRSLQGKRKTKVRPKENTS